LVRENTTTKPVRTNVDLGVVQLPQGEETELNVSISSIQDDLPTQRIVQKPNRLTIEGQSEPGFVAPTRPGSALKLAKDVTISPTAPGTETQVTKPNPVTAEAAAPVPTEPSTPEPTEETRLVVATLPKVETRPTARTRDVSRPARSSANCSVTLETGVLRGGILALEVKSKCRPDQAFVVSHEGLSFSGRTDNAGEAMMRMPVMNSMAEVDVEFADGGNRSAKTVVPGMDGFVRIGVTWEGAADLDLHALEYGAERGGDGHVWEGSPSSMRKSRRSGGGYLMTLGEENGARSQVYTLPLPRFADEEQRVELELDVSGGSDICGRELPFRMVRGLGQDRISVQVMSVTTESCADNSEIALQAGLPALVLAVE
jgi:hypothetical protein